MNIITFPPAESRAASQEGFCVSSVFLQQRTISCRRWVKNVLITNQLFCFRIDETFLHLFLFESTNRLLLLLLLTNVPVDSDTELILTDWLYWTVTQRLQTLRGDCETKTKTFIHPEQRGGKLHNSGKSQCVFERQWDSKREKERETTNTWNTKHSVMSEETKTSRCTSGAETMEVLGDEEAVGAFSQENTSDFLNELFFS